MARRGASTNIATSAALVVVARRWSCRVAVVARRFNQHRFVGVNTAAMVLHSGGVEMRGAAWSCNQHRGVVVVSVRRRHRGVGVGVGATRQERSDASETYILHKLYKIVVCN